MEYYPIRPKGNSEKKTRISLYDLSERGPGRPLKFAAYQCLIDGILHSIRLIFRVVGSYTFAEDWVLYCRLGEIIEKDSECRGQSFVAVGGAVEGNESSRLAGW